ncbi:MAG: hypothetical protein ABGX42_04700 [Gammaproteobacteria bacterium]
MKISDTIIGSIIIGILVGGAILFTGSSNQDRKHAQFNVLGAPHSDHAFFADKGSNKKFKHKEIIIDLDSDSEMEWHIKLNDIKGDLPKDISDTIEKAIGEALGELPNDLDIKVKIKSKKIEEKTE